MPTVTFVRSDESASTFEAPVGATVMTVAVSHGVSGIVGECGGSLACASCHVYLEQGYGLPTMGTEEDAMLDGTEAPRTDASRLGCQLVLSSVDQDVVVRVAEEL